MPLMSAPIVSRPASVWKVLALAVSAALCLVISTGEVTAQTVDRHGDTFATATPLMLGDSVSGHLHDADDWDVFSIDLSTATGTTDIWAYTSGDDEDADTLGGLYDSDGNLIVFSDDAFFADGRRNFGIRKTVTPGIYYIVVVSYEGDPMNYTLHTAAVEDPGGDTETALDLGLGTPVGGTIDGPDDANYFKLEFTERTHLIIEALSLNLAPLEAQLLDSEGEEISANIYRVSLRSSGLRFPVGFEIAEDFDPGTYYLRVSTPVFEDIGFIPLPETTRSTPFYVYPLEDSDYPEFIDECEASTNALRNPEISDALYGCQWHLNSANNRDINVEPAWADGNLGEGVNIAVVDDGMYHAHEDLVDNVDADRNFDYTGMGDIYVPFEHHGTHVAGIIAARDNDVGVRGVAPRATVYGYNFLAGPGTLLSLLDAMTRHAPTTSVSNNSWGPIDGPWLSPAISFWERAVDSGVAQGNDGKGIFYVFAAGNGHLLGDDSNFDGFSNYYAVTAACAVDNRDARAGYSEAGANLWVCAPANDRPGTLGESAGILTTENSDRYERDFAGTSAAAPIVSGVAALARAANPDLTWRDLKLILAASARKNDPNSTGWEDGATMYGADSPSERYHFNHEYGFGVVDAGAAVDLAKEWTNIPPMTSSSVEVEDLDEEIPDAAEVGDSTTITSTLTLDTSIGFTEFVEINVSFFHDSFRDLEVVLESPSGARSKLAVPFDTTIDFLFGLDYVPVFGSYRFGSAKHLGEDPNGEWKLHITDHIPAGEGILGPWSITVYGHESKAGPPTIDAVEAVDGSLVVAWTEPEQKAGLPVTGYDLRHIRTEEDETDDSNWTVVEDVWSSTGGGPLEYTLDGLTVRERHDIQVRATNAWGTGEWSDSALGTPGNAKPVFAEGERTDRSVPENTPAYSFVGLPVVASDADGDTLTYALGGDDAASFDVNPATGQITVGPTATLDYEAQTTESDGVVSTDAFVVEVTATDIFDVTATITVVITVTNVDLPGKANNYDVDKNERIDRNEAVAAVRDYFDGILTKEETLDIIKLYFR